MKDFTIRAGALLLIVAALFTYNMVISLREKDDQIARLAAEVQAMENQKGEPAGDSDSAAEESGYKDGTYEGSAEGYGGQIQVSVQIQNGTIAAIDILSAPGEDAAYFSSAKAVIQKVLDAQTTEVDTVSGATFSSTGILNAVTVALNSAL